jgi:hypothetical protein
MQKLTTKKYLFSNWRLLQVVLVVASFFLISVVQKTFSLSSDTETSHKNKFMAGEMDLSLNSKSDFSPKVTPDDPADAQLKVKDENEVPFDYSVKADNFSGDLCDKLNLQADRKGDGTDEYTSNLKSFRFDVQNFSGEELWKFKASLKETNSDLQNSKCEFNMVFKASQIANNPPPGQGFSDAETTTFTIESGEWDDNSDKNDMIQVILPAAISNSTDTLLENAPTTPAEPPAEDQTIQESDDGSKNDTL